LSSSGFGYVINTISTQIWLIVVFISMVILALYRYKINLRFRFILFVSMFIAMLIINNIIYNYFKIDLYVGLVLRLLIAYYTVRILDMKFIKVYIIVMSYLSILTLSLYLLILMKILPMNIFKNIGFIVQQSNLSEQILSGANVLLRNCGPFWEPGAFGGYLVIALALNIFIYNQKVLCQTNIILVLGILSTQSTTAYLGVGVILLIIYYQKTGGSIISIFTGLTIIFSFFYLLNKSEIVYPKIYEQYQAFLNYFYGYNTTWNSQRFISTYTDYLAFIENPIFGLGLNVENRFNAKYYIENASSTNGWMNFLTRWGIVGFSLYLYTFYKSLIVIVKRHCVSKKMAAYLLLIILFIASSEDYFYYPFFWALTVYKYAIKAEDVDVDNKRSSKSHYVISTKTS